MTHHPADPADPTDTADPAARLLRETLDAYEPLAPAPADLAGSARRRAGRTTRWRAVVAGTAATALVVTGVAVVLGRGAVRVAPAPEVSVAATPTATVRPGWKHVSSLGVQLAVPQDWDVVGAIGGCEPLPAATVERGGGVVAGCGYTEPAGFTLVHIGTVDDVAGLTDPRGDGSGTPAPGGSPSTVPLSRIPMDLTVSALSDDRTQLVLASAERDVAVLVRGPDLDLLQEILLTVELVDVDSAGCSAVQTARPSWDRAGRLGVPAVDVGAADAVSVCAYSTRDDDVAPRLAASARLDGPDAREVLDALAAAPAGTVPFPPAIRCAPARYRTTPESGLELLVNAAGTTTPVRVHYDGCGDRYAASPDGLSQVTMRLLEAAYRPLGLGFSTLAPLP